MYLYTLFVSLLVSVNASSISSDASSRFKSSLEKFKILEKVNSTQNLVPNYVRVKSSRSSALPSTARSNISIGPKRLTLKPIVASSQKSSTLSTPSFEPVISSSPIPSSTKSSIPSVPETLEAEKESTTALFETVAPEIILPSPTVSQVGRVVSAVNSKGRIVPSVSPIVRVVPVVEQAHVQTFSMDQTASDAPPMDQVTSEAPLMERNLPEVPSMDQTASDAPPMDQDVPDAPPMDQAATTNPVETDVSAPETESATSRGKINLESFLKHAPKTDGNNNGLLSQLLQKRRQGISKKNGHLSSDDEEENSSSDDDKDKNKKKPEEPAKTLKKIIDQPKHMFRASPKVISGAGGFNEKDLISRKGSLKKVSEQEKTYSGSSKESTSGDKFGLNKLGAGVSDYMSNKHEDRSSDKVGEKYKEEEEEDGEWDD